MNVIADSKIDLLEDSVFNPSLPLIGKANLMPITFFNVRRNFEDGFRIISPILTLSPPPQPKTKRRGVEGKESSAYQL